MKQIALLYFLFFAYISFAQSPLPAPADYRITNVSVIAMRQGKVIKSQTVYVRDGKILAMGAASNDPMTGRWSEIDGTGKYLMPGISEMHAHIPVPRDGDDQNVRETLFLYLSNGITTIRGMLGNPYHLELKQQVADAEVLSPRIYTSSPSMNGNSVQSPEQAQAKVTQYWEEGYDFLKIHPGIDLPVMKELVATAQNLQIAFSGHVPYDVGIDNALDFGYASIDHADGYIEGMVPGDVDFQQGGFFGSNFARDVDIDKLKGLCSKTADRGVWIVPTQSLFTRWISPDPPEEMIQAAEMQYMPARVRYSWVQGKSQIVNSPEYSADDYQVYLKLRQRILKSLHDAGVPFLLGSDAPQVFNVPGFSIQHEMQAVSDAGLSNIEVLRSGTVNPAKFFGEEGAYGEVTTGAAADLILLGANPLEDLQHMRNIEGVMVRGTWLSRSVLDDELTRIAARHADE